MYKIIIKEISNILINKNITGVVLDCDTVLLSSNLQIDSLDLAVLLVSLEEKTGKNPFKDGFKMFNTIGDLVNLYNDAGSK
jgi:acyl carrier protein